MKLFVVTSEQGHSLFRKVCDGLPEEWEKDFCDYHEALEKLLIEEPTHVLIDMDREVSREVLRDLQGTFLQDQRILVTSFQRSVNFDGVEAEDFLRKPYKPQELVEFLSRNPEPV